MPKRKRNTARAQQRAEAKAANEKHKQASLKTPSKSKSKSNPNPRDQPPSSSSSSKTPTLGTLFASLPAELRASIFATLLSRPSKWTARHTATCTYGAGRHYHHPAWPGTQHVRSCATQHQYLGSWRRRQGNPGDEEVGDREAWRSEWAPAVANEFLCVACWDGRFRCETATTVPAPRVDSLPCGCARTRRADGLRALLVCRAWYEEGAHVSLSETNFFFFLQVRWKKEREKERLTFVIGDSIQVLYTRNTFSFSSPRECVQFFEGLNPRWSSLVSKVSLLFLDLPSEVDVTVPLNSRDFRRAWQALRKLPALSELELDAAYLTDLGCVRVLRGPHLRNLRRIHFTEAARVPTTEVEKEMRQDFVWPWRALRESIEDTEFTVDVARGIKGWRYGWGKARKRSDEQVVSIESEGYKARFKARENYRERKRW